ncbi:MAG: 8-oxo-dGTP diphosphatase [Verrucomicrobiota bacterium]
MATIQEASDIDWSRWQPNMRATLLFIRRGEEVLLMRKKRGLGAGKINAPGGKIEPGESPEECAIRETQEELCITASHLAYMGENRFQFSDGLAIQCYVFLSEQFEGIPTETEEADPKWTKIEAIPYQEMWEDDQYWLPQILAGQTFLGCYFFKGDRLVWKDLQFDQ